MGLAEHAQDRTTGAGTPGHRTARDLMTRAGLGAILLSGTSMLGGCALDSFLDPSIIGRWEPTPTSVPILDRISVIEDDMGELVEMSDVTPDDLIADAREYRISPGDRLLITLYDFEDRSGGTEFPRDVDLQGNIDLPQLGFINVAGRTVTEAQAEVARVMQRLVIDPLVAIVPAAQRQQTFAVVGSVESPGPYFIPRPDYRLLEALTSSGRFPESTDEVYVIRQIPLSDAIRPSSVPSAPKSGSSDASAPASGENKGGQPLPAENLIDLIDELAKPSDGAPAAEPSTKPVEPPPPAEDLPADSTPPAEPKRSAPALLRPAIDLDGSQPADAPPPANVEPAASSNAPAIDLVQPGEAAAPAVGLHSSRGEPTWVFVNGEWVMIKNERGGASGQSTSAGADSRQEINEAGQLVTQRVIRVPLKSLLAGDARYNIVIRPGDTIRVPASVAGLVYMTGQVQRPGPYSLPDVGKLTLLRAIDSAGGLSAIAVPERCDVTRIVGKDRQATIRLNLRAISEQTEPDLYLKPDDRINVGTNFWALPLAVLRGGIRTNYGFGFVIDRNFGNDIFGPPPESNGF